MADPYVYEPQRHLPTAWIFDMDGTLAIMDGRTPSEYHLVGTDKVHEAVAALAKTLATEHDIVLLTGRDEEHRPETEDWLKRHEISYDVLIMRSLGDRRPDNEVKLDLFRGLVDPYYHVLGVFEDRQRVVDMWRSIGLLCAQVDVGAF